MQKKYFNYILKLFIYPFLYLLYFVSGFFKRDKKIWVFGCQKNKFFSDNAKYLFLYTDKRKKAVWISSEKKIIKKLREKGYCAYLPYSFEGIYYSLKGYYHIFDTYPTDINWWLSRNAKIVNLWHGIPLKKIEFDIKKTKLKNIYNSKGIGKIIYSYFFPWVFKKPHMVISTSSFTQGFFRSAFRANNSPVTGYPRNDVFFKDIKDSDIGSFDFDKKESKAVLFLPTFRDTSLYKNEEYLIKILNSEKLQILAEKENFYFFIKPHPMIKIKAKRHKRFIVIPSYLDMYPFLKKTDVLITDYSSVFFDFLLLDKPIIFFACDIEKYNKKDREFYIDYYKNTPGYKAHNLNELLISIQKTIKEDSFSRKRERNLFFKYNDGKSSERIFNILNL